ncbi:HEXXH motif domain-containing protein [Streptomyces sp. NPDC127098]|uniref:HEXXH motif domain-containing protein n=1 Tax=Streptomyces sp. NPDC127098 TaxID=3347137 RepID=UPI003668A249
MLERDRAVTEISDIAEVADLPLDSALSVELPEEDVVAQRVRARFTRPWLSRGDSAAPPSGGYSWGRHTPATNDDELPAVSYAPPPQGADKKPEDRQDEEDPDDQALRPSGEATVVAPGAGREPQPGIDTLRHQQHGIRRFMLGELLRAAGDVTLTGPLPPIADARDLLVDADRAAPAAVANILLYPSTGRWLSHVLRRLHAADEGPVPFWVDLGHLHAIASAAAIRANLDFAFQAPAREGAVLLPTLGLARLGDVGTVAAEISAANGHGVISHGRASVAVPGPTAPGWLPLRRVTAESGTRELTLCVDDLDTFRDADPPTAPMPLPEGEVTRWRRLIEGAWRLIVDLDAAQAASLATALSSLTPKAALPDGGVTSLSSSEAFGGVVLTMPADPVQLAETLVHEFQHMRLNAMLDTTEFLERPVARDALFYAPWRNDPRPLEGVFHGIFAFFGVTEFWLHVSRSAGDERSLRRARFELAYWRIQTWDTFTALRTHRRFTADGRRFLREMSEGAVEWRREPVPTDVVQLAREAVVAHRALWRLHHLRAAPSVVAELTDAWRAGRPPAQYVSRSPSLLRPMATEATDLNSAVSPYRRAAVDDAQPDGLLGPVERERPTDPGAWLRLGLALRAAAPSSPAARALVHRPELVRDVHESLRSTLAGTTTPTDLIPLAAWLGAPGDQDIPPVFSP